MSWSTLRYFTGRNKISAILMTRTTYLSHLKLVGWISKDKLQIKALPGIEIHIDNTFGDSPTSTKSWFCQEKRKRPKGNDL